MFFPEQACSAVDGQHHLINELLVPGSGWTVIGVIDINERGEIAAFARQGQQPYRAVLLRPRVQPTPVQEVEAAPEEEEER